MVLISFLPSGMLDKSALRSKILAWLSLNISFVVFEPLLNGD